MHDWRRSAAHTNFETSELSWLSHQLMLWTAPFVFKLRVEFAGCANSWHMGSPIEWLPMQGTNTAPPISCAMAGVLVRLFCGRRLHPPPPPARARYNPFTF